MNFNGVNEYLYRWCVDRREAYFQRSQQERADTGRSLLFIKRYFFDEMAYKLLYLVDEELESLEAWRSRVRELIPLRRSYLLEHRTDPEELELLREAEEECRAFAQGMTEADTMEPECYCRVLHGAERERLEYAILEKWGYCANYWYPLKGEPDESKLFLDVDHLEPYWDRLCALAGLPEQRLYEYGESFFEDGALSEVDAIEGYGGNECAYLPKDLSWIIYFSHENTITFAGDILPMVKELLKAEREHWNRWD